MAMFTAAGTYQGAALIREKYEAGFVDAVYRNNQLLGIKIGGRPLFPSRDSGGDTAIRWKVVSAGNTSVEIFTENQVQPTAVAQTWRSMAVNFVYFRAMIQYTGHAVDAMRSNWVDGLAQEFELSEMDIRDLMTTTFLGSTYGLEQIISATTTYAGQARGSAAWWESSATTVSAALAYTHLVDLHETVRDNDKGGQVGLWMVPHNQLSNYAYLVGNPNTQNSSFNVEMGTGRGLDLGYNVNAMGCMGAPIIPIGDMTNETWLAIDNRPGFMELVIHRPFGLKKMAPSGDSDVFQVSTACAIAHKNPKTCGTLLSVTA